MAPPNQPLRRLKTFLSMPRKAGAIPLLDGLRAIAILLVLGRHATRVFDLGANALLPLGLWEAASPLINGWVGVDLFFVLSGFLITFHLLRRWKQGNPGRQMRRYLLKRVLRIFPAYYAFLLIVVAGLIPGLEIYREGLLWRTIYHLLYLQDYLGPDIVVAFWSLGVEEKFYLAAPLLIVPLLRGSVRWRYRWLAGLFVLPSILRAFTYLSAESPWTYETYFLALRSPFHMSFEGLVAGCACAFLLEDSRSLSPDRKELYGQRLTWSGGLGLLALILPFPLLETPTFFSSVLLGSFLALGFSALLLGLLLHPGRVGSWLSARWLLFFSVLSYSIYLVHMPFMNNTYRWLDSAWEISTWALPLQFAVYLPIFSIISIAAALLLHYLVEKPFLYLKDRV